MIDQDTVDWLTDRRPEVADPDPLTTDRLHREFASRRRRRPPRFAVVAALAAVVVAVMAVAGQSLPKRDGPPVATRPSLPTAGPLLTLARDVASADLSPERARAKVYGAAPMPQGEPPSAAPAAERAKVLEEKNIEVEDVKPASLQSRRDNYLWMNAMDAITAGAGRADVRAGAMNALSTIDAVHVEETTLAVLVHFRGGTADEAGVDVTYDIKRVRFDGATIAPAHRG